MHSNMNVKLVPVNHDYQILLCLCLILVKIAGLVLKVALMLFFEGVKTSY